MLISFVVTAKLICVFVFAYAKSRFSHDAAHIVLYHDVVLNQKLLILETVYKVNIHSQKVDFYTFNATKYVYYTVVIVIECPAGMNIKSV